MHLNAADGRAGVSTLLLKDPGWRGIGQDPEILLRGGDVMPEVAVLCIRIGIGDPGLLEPFVNEGKLDSSSTARILDIIKHPHIVKALLLLRDASVVHARGSQMGSTPAGREPEFGNDQGDILVMGLQILQIAQVGVGPDGI